MRSVCELNVHRYTRCPYVSLSHWAFPLPLWMGIVLRKNGHETHALNLQQLASGKTRSRIHTCCFPGRSRSLYQEKWNQEPAVFLTLKDLFQRNGSFLTGIKNDMNCHFDAVICNFYWMLAMFCNKFPLKPQVGKWSITELQIQYWGIRTEKEIT